jgi:hypothetical protein
MIATLSDGLIPDAGCRFKTIQVGPNRPLACSTQRAGQLLARADDVIE